MPTLHGIPLSPFVRKVRVALFEKGVAHDLNPVVPLPPANDDPQFRAMSPLGKIPAYQDGDFAISDSSIILNYLDAVEPNPKLIPDDPQARARALWFEELGDSRLAEGVGPVFRERIVHPKLMNLPTDEAVIQTALTETLPPLLAYLEGQLSDDEALVGGRFSIADIGICSMFRQFQMAGESVDAAKYPKLAAYVERILARPSFKTAADEEDQIAANMLS